MKYRFLFCLLGALLAAEPANALNLNGYVVRQTNDYRSYNIPTGNSVSGGGYVVIGRNASKSAFESYWGVTLATNVTYLNAANSFPKIDGSERYWLATNTLTLDGLTPSTINPLNKSVQRINATSSATLSSSWNVVSWSAATPGHGGAGNGNAGLVINEYSDANNFSYEFIELYYDYAVSNIPPVLQAIGNRIVTVSNLIQFAVAATITDGDTTALSISNAPPGSSFASTNENGTFTWTNPTPIGVYTTTFYAVDHNGVDFETITISVLSPPTLCFAASESIAGEDAQTQLVAVVASRQADAAVKVTYSGTATYGTNQDYYIASTNLTFTSTGPTQVYVTVKIVNDSATEPLEAAVLSLTNATQATIGSPQQHTLTIRDNDAITIMSANLTSGHPAVYREPGCRILQGLKPDIVAIEECNVTNAGGYRTFVDQNFGTNFYYYVEPQATNFFPQPCGIISRWPILDSGEWSDTETVNRDFAWATIDIPGDRNLHVISVHLYYSGGPTIREQEARALTNYIAEAGFPANDYLVIAGDFNTLDRSEPCLAVLTNIVSDGRKPADQFGNTDTSLNRDQPFDYVLPNALLNSNHYTVTISGSNFTEGVVFDSRLWTNGTPPPSPILVSDSSATGNAHMAVMKAFSLGRTPPSLQSIGDQFITRNLTLQFGVTALGTDGDTPTLTASNLPPGATFAATGGDGWFTWTNASPVGTYTSKFVAADGDGIEQETVLIRVLVAGDVWINEFHYDNASTDTNEGVEIAGPAGIDLSFYSLCAYNGGDGSLYSSNALSGVIDDEGCGYGAVWVPIDGLQNGPDGIALVQLGTNVVQFLSYEDMVTAVDGPAVELSSTDIGVHEAGTETGKSLQLGGSGTNYPDFGWAGPSNAASRGTLNSSQTIYPCGSTTNQPPMLYYIGNREGVLSNTLSFTVQAMDVDGDPITITASNLPSGATFSSISTNGYFTWTNAAPLGVYTTAFYATDNDGTDSETITIWIVSGVEPPVLDTIGNQSVIQGLTLSFDVTATDAESDPITLTLSNAPAGSTFSSDGGNGTFSWTNAGPIGVYTSRFYAVDKDGTDYEIVRFHVTAPTNLPLLQSIGSHWINANDTLTFGITAIDADQDAITLSVSNAPPASSFSSSGGNGTFIWSNAIPIGVYTSTFYATDNDGTDSEAVSIRVLKRGVIWINEIHYDNTGSDTNEGVEVAGTAGLDLSVYSLYAYNGTDGAYYSVSNLSGQVDDEGCGYGAVWFGYPKDGLQQGPDGLALVDAGTHVVWFLSYEGAFFASNGPAAGSVSLDIKVQESSSTPVGNSMQLLGAGTSYVDFGWSGPTNMASPGSLNSLQTIHPCSSVTNPPVITYIGDKTVVASNTLTFAVSATEPDGDSITLTVSNAPAGSNFSSTEGNGTFTWTNASPVGIYTTCFYAVDKDGVDYELVKITVEAWGAGTLVFYSFENESGGFTNVATSVHSNLSASIYSTDNGEYDGTTDGHPGQAIYDNGWKTMHYYLFSITMATGYQANVTNFQFQSYRSATGPTNWVIRYSGDSYATDLGAGSQTEAATWYINSTALALTGLTGTITFYVYGTNAGSGSGTWRIDNIQLLGRVEVLLSNDFDGDGLPNDWETLYFGDATSAVPSANGDEDALNNMAEFIAGTVPTNSASYFAANAMVAASTGRVEFSSMTNRKYGIFQSTNLMTGPWLPYQTNISGSGNTISIILTNTPYPAYYRPKVSLP